MLKLDGAGCSCNYAMCTQAGGHASCGVVMDHYQRLCAAAQALVADPDNQDLQDALLAVLNEETGLEG